VFFISFDKKSFKEQKPKWQKWDLFVFFMLKENDSNIIKVN